MLKGSLVAIVSPMHEDGSLDLDALRRSRRRRPRDTLEAVAIHVADSGYRR